MIDHKIELNKFYESDFIHDKLMYFYHTEFSNDLKIISFTDSGCVDAIALVETKEADDKPEQMRILDYMLIHADASKDEVESKRILDICDKISTRLFLRNIEFI